MFFLYKIVPVESSITIAESLDKLLLLGPLGHFDFCAVVVCLPVAPAAFTIVLVNPDKRSAAHKKSATTLFFFISYSILE